MSLASPPVAEYLAALAAEQEAGLIPEWATRPLYPWEVGTVDFAQIANDQEVAYAVTAGSVDKVRDAVIDAMTAALGDGTEEQVAAELAAFGAKQPPLVRDAIEQATRDIAGALGITFDRAGQGLVVDAEGQGVTHRPVTTKPDADTRKAHKAMAGSAPSWVWQRLNQVATTTGGPTAPGKDAVMQAVQAAPMDGGYDLARQAVHVAHGEGRAKAAAALPEPARIYASELLDAATCKPCERIDGTQYQTVAEADADYPEGGYRSCSGGHRCRGTLVYVWQDEERPTDEGLLPYLPVKPSPPPPVVQPPPPPKPEPKPVEAVAVTYTEHGLMTTYADGSTVESFHVGRAADRKVVQRRIDLEWGKDSPLQVTAPPRGAKNPSVAVARDAETGKIVGLTYYDRQSGLMRLRETQLHPAAPEGTGQELVHHVRTAAALEGRAVYTDSGQRLPDLPRPTLTDPVETKPVVPPPITPAPQLARTPRTGPAPAAVKTGRKAGQPITDLLTPDDWEVNSALIRERAKETNSWFTNASDEASRDAHTDEVLAIGNAVRQEATLRRMKRYPGSSKWEHLAEMRVEVLSEIRAMGGDLNVVRDNDGARYRPGQSPVELVKRAAQCYPSAWLDDLRNAKGTLGARTVKRGFYSDARSLIAISGNGGDSSYSTALHELGHAMQHNTNRNRVLRAENWYHRRRTTHNGRRDDIVSVSPGLKDERGRPDKYPLAYSGREYAPMQGSGLGYLEVLTTTAETTFGSSNRADTEMTEWLLGLMAVL